MSAASIRGYYDTSEYLMDELLLRAATLLETLDHFLTKKLGSNWWRETEIEEFAPKRKDKR